MLSTTAGVAAGAAFEPCALFNASAASAFATGTSRVTASSEADRAIEGRIRVPPPVHMLQGRTRIARAAVAGRRGALRNPCFLTGNWRKSGLDSGRDPGQRL